MVLQEIYRREGYCGRSVLRMQKNETPAFFFVNCAGRSGIIHGCEPSEWARGSGAMATFCTQFTVDESFW